MRKFGMCVVAVLLVGFSVAIAEDFTATITKVDGDKITCLKKKKGDKKGEEVTLTVAKDAKVVKGKVNFDKDTKKITVEEGDAIEGGLKSETFTKISDKGVGARITTNDGGTVTKIVVTGGKKKKGA